MMEKSEVGLDVWEQEAWCARACALLKVEPDCKLLSFFITFYEQGKINSRT
jgi:hypothetical protein